MRKKKPFKKIESVKDVYTLSKERIREAYKQFDTIIVSWSGGKDSTAVLEVTLEVARELNKLPLKVVFFDEEATTIHTEKLAESISNREELEFYWFCLPIKSNNSCSNESPFWFPWHKDQKELWVRDLPEKGITSIPGIDFYSHEYSISDVVRLLFNGDSYGQVGLLLGIRAQESLLRCRVLLMKKQENHIVKDNGDYYRDSLVGKNMYRVYPIYDWKTEDIWLAIAKKGWEYNASYDILNMYGVSPFNQRVGPPYHSEAKKTLKRYKECFPESWEKMQNRVPGANTVSKWGATQIYGDGNVYEMRNKGQTWEDLIKGKLEEIDSPGKKLKVGKLVKAAIDYHYRKTKDPILIVPHVQSGVSWKLLVHMVLSGDLKNRKFSQRIKWSRGTKEETRCILNYEEEYKRYLEVTKNGEIY